jgi:hypothetical protein
MLCRTYIASEIWKAYIRKSDAGNLNFVSDGSIYLICAHPFYVDIINSKNIPENLSLLKVKDFLEETKKVVVESSPVLGEEKSAPF